MNHHSKQTDFFLKDEDQMIEDFNNSYGNPRHHTAIQLGKLRSKKAVKSLILGLFSIESKVTRSAAYALGEIGDPAAVDPLIAVLNDKRFSVRCRRSAAHALGKIGDKKAIRSLSQCLHEEDPKLRKIATVALGCIGNLNAIDLLVKTAKTDANITVKRTAIKALSQLKPDGIDQLFTLFLLDDVDIQTEAFHALLDYHISNYSKNIGAQSVDIDTDILKNTEVYSFCCKFCPSLLKYYHF